MNPKRVRTLKAGDLKKVAIVYWMSREQRTQDNWALLFSQELSQREKVPLAVVFCLAPQFLGATFRQYAFMIQGLSEVEQNLAAKNIPFYLLRGSPEVEIAEFIKKIWGGWSGHGFRSPAPEKAVEGGGGEKTGHPLL